MNYQIIILCLTKVKHKKHDILYYIVKVISHISERKIDKPRLQSYVKVQSYVKKYMFDVKIMHLINWADLR